MKRSVVPEILDQLPPEDPEAVRARKDLRRINWLMGNHRWLKRQLAAFEGASILEMGAGDGGLLCALDFSGKKIAGLDLAPRPADLPAEIGWIRGDLFETLPAALEKEPGGEFAIIANLFLHHFETESLETIGRLLRDAAFLCFSEPFRSRLPLVQSTVLVPFINRVTRHDMPVSIRAGFRPGELPALLDLHPDEWQIRERVNALGAYRLAAWKRQ